MKREYIAATVNKDLDCSSVKSITNETYQSVDMQMKAIVE